MIAVTATQMREIDHYAVARMEIPELVLMENAALAVLHCIEPFRKSFAIFCGTGNNGGDGLALARALLTRGREVRVFLVGDRRHATEAFQVNYRILLHMDCPMRWMTTIGDIQDLPAQFEQVNTLIDCLIGTGLEREVKGMKAYVIEAINAAHIHTISVDVPSGMNATTGAMHGACVDADRVICLQLLKRGLQENGLLRAEVDVVPIGIPRQAIRAVLNQAQ